MPVRSLIRRCLRFLLRLAAGLAAVLLWAWTALALHFSNLPSAWLRTALALLFALGAPAALLVFPRRGRTAAGLLATALLVIVWWVQIEPSHDRDWAPDHARMPLAEFAGDRVTVKNVRNCLYRSAEDYDVRWEDRSFDLAALRSLHFVVEPFSEWEGLAHVFLTFGFEGGEALAVSVEARRERGERYVPWKGLFKQYELTYVVGDERDLIGLRAAHRRHPVYLYPIRTVPEDLRALFVHMLERSNRLAARPEFYNTLFSTCATNVLAHVNRVLLEQVGWSRRILFPGLADRVAYERGLIDTELPFEEARRRFRIDERARAHAGSPEFSAKIRE